jgi:hypothetical protein
MKLWELRSYDQVIKLEQERLVYQARLRSRFGRAWRRKAPVESLMPLRLARYGVPLAETAPAGLAAAGIEPALLPPAPHQQLPAAPREVAAGSRAAGAAPVPQKAAPPGEQRHNGGGNQNPGYPDNEPAPDPSPWFQAPHEVEYHGGYDPNYDPSEQYAQWYEQEQEAVEYREQYEEEPPAPGQEPAPEETGTFPIPVTPGRTRELGEGGGTPEPDEEARYLVFKQSINGSYPTPSQFSDNVEATYGAPVADAEAKRMVMRFQNRHTAELEEDHIA